STRLDATGARWEPGMFEIARTVRAGDTRVPALVSRHAPERQERAAMHVDATRTLLLNQGYEPIKVISWQRAITLLTLSKVEVIGEYDAQIRACAMIIQVPAVVRLRKAFRRHAKPVKFSRVNIYARDGHRCQYCGARCAIDRLTYDHVIPRSRGG